MPSSSTPRPWILAETHWPDVQEDAWEVAVLPWGATEPHNLHLPYGTDVYESSTVAEEAGRLAWEEGARVMVLPPVPFGVQTSMLDLTFSINMNPTTQLAVLRDVARSLDGQGIRKLVVLNGHGGNDFKPLIREIQPTVGIFLCAVNWYHSADETRFFDDAGDHGGELETSVMMHLYPSLVKPLDEAGPGQDRPWRIDAMREGWAWAPRPWSQLTDDTGVGNPAAATADRGERFFRAVTENIGAFLVDLADANPKRLLE